MTINQVRNFIRYPLDGRDLRILSESHPDGFQLKECDVLPRSTLRRRTRELVDLGLVEPTSEAKRNRRFAARRPGIASAAQDALNERPSLADDLHTPTHLAVLSAFPHPHGSPRARDLVGVAEGTWRDAVDRLTDRNLLLEGDASLEPNPRLSALGRLLKEYGELYEEPPDGATATEAPPGIEVAGASEATEAPGGTEVTGASEATDVTEGPDRAGRAESGGDGPTDGPTSYQPIHRRGVEAAWRFRNADLGPALAPVGPSTDLPLFDPIAPAATYGYHGPRDLDEWDHMLLYCRAERTPRSDARTVPDPMEGEGPGEGPGDGPGEGRGEESALRSPPPVDLPARLKALFIAGTGPAIDRDQRFLDRALFYGLGWLVDEAIAYHRTGDHPLEDEIRRFREDFDVEEGQLVG